MNKDIDKERFIERVEYKLFGILIFEKIRYFDSSIYSKDKDELTIENKEFMS